MASPSPALFLAALLAVLRVSGHVAAAGTNLTAGVPMTPPNYITSPSGAFAFGFRALADGSGPGKFLLATWFRSGSDDDGRPSGSSSSQLQSVVWFARQSSTYSSAALATAQSALSVTADGQLALADTSGGGNRVLWRAPIPSLKRGSVLALLDSGNLQFLGDGSGQEDVLWASFWCPTDTLLPGQSLTMDARSQGKLISRRADAEFTTGRFTMGVQTDGNVVLYVDLLSGNSPDNAYWQAHTDSSSGNTTVTFDEQGGLSTTLYNGVVQNLISPVATGKVYRFARMDPDGVVRAYVRAKNVLDGGGSTSWSVSGAFPSDACNKRTSGLKGVCGPGSYCTEQKDRLSCVCPDRYTYADPQHTDSGCTPEFAPQSCDGENNTGEYTLVDLPNTTWEASIYYKKFTSVTEDQCRDYCLNDCYCAAALMIGGTDCAEMAALTNGRQASDVTTKALIKVRRSNNPPARMSARTRAIAAVTVGEDKSHSSRDSLRGLGAAGRPRWLPGKALPDQEEEREPGLAERESFQLEGAPQGHQRLREAAGKRQLRRGVRGRAQVPAAAPRRGEEAHQLQRVQREGVQQRGAVHRADPPPEPGPHDRLLQGRQAPDAGAGVHAGRVAARLPLQAGAAAVELARRGGARHRQVDRVPPRRVRLPDHALRHQAGQHPPGRRARPQDHRLRDLQAAGQPAGAHHGDQHQGHQGVHRPGVVPQRRADRHQGGRVQLRRRAAGDDLLPEVP